ncbi:MAG: TIGR00180 family glycosyltransferase [Chitinophagaceae bacterium]|nr:TIGR00180 family glycosyltransferase [Chitinophagaceae bacterium]MCW5926255.1 TIGR00180 family glycosyltransferase [Chitinophagaceae bacterium]
MFDTITLIIPTHNRPELLDRALAYYEDFRIRTIIVDSSALPFEAADKFIGVTYLYRPDLQLNEKISYALSSVKTPYVVLCADDDFIVKETLIKCISFLEENKDYSVAMGSNIYFSVIGNTGRKKILVTPIYKGEVAYEIKNENSLDRLHDFFGNYRAIFYGVQRASILHMAFEDLSYVKNLLLNEYASALFPVITGKIKAFDDLYQMREYLGIPQAGIPNIDQIYRDESLYKEYQTIVDRQSAKIAAYTKLDFAALRTKIDQALTGYAKHYELPWYLNIKSRMKRRYVWFLLSDFLSFFPFIQLKEIINVYRIAKVARVGLNKSYINNVSNFLRKYYSDK